MDSKLEKQIVKEGEIMGTIRKYLCTIMEESKANKKAEEFNNLFEKLHNERD